MSRSVRLATVCLVLLSLSATGAYTRAAHGQAAPPQYPLLYTLANKVIQKYQQSTCDGLRTTKSRPAPPSAEEQRLLTFLHSDYSMRAEFLNRVAAPIA